MDILSARDVLDKGLAIMGMRTDGRSGWFFHVLAQGVAPTSEFIRDVFDFYCSEDNNERDFFVNLAFDQFKERLVSYIKDTQKNLTRSTQEEEWLVHDRVHYPRATHNERGEPVFDMDPAKLLLREDVENGLASAMSPQELWASRPEYHKFKLAIFRHRIYQEIRLSKYINYLEEKRRVKRDGERATRNQDV